MDAKESVVNNQVAVEQDDPDPAYVTARAQELCDNVRRALDETYRFMAWAYREMALLAEKRIGN